MAKCCGQETYDEKRPNADRRLQLMQEIRAILGDVKQNEHGHRRARDAGRGGSAPGCPDMDEECRQYRKRRACTPPLITSIALHETRPTSDYSKMQHESSKRLTYVDASAMDQGTPMPPAPWELPRTPSQELRAGTLYQSCECTKRNGLQHDCPRWDCGGRPECVAINPGPCCPTSIARKPVRGDRRQASNQTQTNNVKFITPIHEVFDYMNYQSLEQHPNIVLKEILGLLGVTPQPTKQRSVELAQIPPPSKGRTLYPGKMPQPQINSALPMFEGPNVVCFCQPAETGSQNPVDKNADSKNEHPRMKQEEFFGVVRISPQTPNQRAMEFVEMAPLIDQGETHRGNDQSGKSPGIQNQSSGEVNVVYLCNPAEVITTPDHSRRQLPMVFQRQESPRDADNVPQRVNVVSFCALNPSKNMDQKEFMVMVHSDAMPVFSDPLPLGSPV